MKITMRTLLSVAIVCLLALSGSATHVYAAEDTPVAAPSAGDSQSERDLARYYFDLARVHAAHGFYDKAIEALYNAEIQPCDPAFQRVISERKAQLLAKMGKSEAAVAQYEKAIKSATSKERRKELSLALAELQMKMDNPGSAAETYRTVASGATEPWLRHRATRSRLAALEKTDALDETIQKNEELLAQDPQNLEALNVLLIVYSELRPDIPKALSLCKRLLEKAPDDSYLLARLAELYVKGEQLGDAAEIYAQLIEKEPHQKQEYYSRIIAAYLEADDKDKAVEWAAKARTAGGDDAAAWSRYGQICIQAERPDEGLKALKKAVEVAGGARDREFAQLRLAQAYEQLDKNDEALKIYKELSKKAKLPAVRRLAASQVRRLQ